MAREQGVSGREPGASRGIPTLSPNSLCLSLLNDSFLCVFIKRSHIIYFQVLIVSIRRVTTCKMLRTLPSM